MSTMKRTLIYSLMKSDEFIYPRYYHRQEIEKFHHHPNFLVLHPSQAPSPTSTLKEPLISFLAL